MHYEVAVLDNHHRELSPRNTNAIFFSSGGEGLGVKGNYFLVREKGGRETGVFVLSNGNVIFDILMWIFVLGYFLFREGEAVQLGFDIFGEISLSFDFFGGVRGFLYWGFPPEIRYSINSYR